MSGFSFSFSKKVQPSKIQPSKLRDESTKEDEEEKDFVTSVEGKEIKGTKKVEEKKEWIIPLIKQNKWRLEDGIDRKENDTDDFRRGTKSGKIDGRDHTVSSTVPEPEPISEEEALRRQALKELLEEAGNVETKEANSFEIPLLLQNKVPAGFEEDDNLNVSLRAEQSTVDDYEQFPIEQFGKAMLRGMGWKEEEGIGKTNKSVVDLKEPTLRPKGLGLGAERPQANKDTVSQASSKKEEKLVMKIGAYVKINKGPNKGSYGQIQSFDEDNNRVVVKLSLNSKMADVSKFYVDVVPESEFKSKSRILNNEKYEEYKKIHDEKDRDREAKRRERSDEDEERTSSRRRKDEDYDKRSSRKDAVDNDDDYDRKSSRRRREDDEEDRIRPSRRDDDDYDRKSSRRKEEDGHKISRRKKQGDSDQDISGDSDSDDDQSRDRHRSKHKTDSSKSSSSKHSKKHKKEKKKKKKKHRRDSSTSSTSSSSSSRSRSRHRKRN